jgi:hypothetical protein
VVDGSPVAGAEVVSSCVFDDGAFSCFLCFDLLCFDMGVASRLFRSTVSATPSWAPRWYPAGHDPARGGGQTVPDLLGRDVTADAPGTELVGSGFFPPLLRRRVGARKSWPVVDPVAMVGRHR